MADAAKLEVIKEEFAAAPRMVVGYHCARGLSERDALVMGMGFLIEFHRVRRGHEETERIFNLAMDAIERGALS